MIGQQATDGDGAPIVDTTPRGAGADAVNRVQRLGTLVTGGSGGIGSAVVRRMAVEGRPVLLTYRRAAPDELMGEVNALGGDVRAFQVAMDDIDGLRALVAEAKDVYGGIDVVVHAAGPHVPMRHLSLVEEGDFLQQVTDDVAGFFNVVKAVLPELRTHQGVLIAVTTAATTRFPVRDGLSSVPKGAVESLIRAIAAEEGRYGVRANCVGPGMLLDGMAERLIASGDLNDRALEVAKQNIPLGRFGRAADIAEAVRFLASAEARFVTGQKLDVDGGYGL